MIVIRANNVNSALSQALQSLLAVGITEPSRNGPVLKFPEPVTTVYERPTERVLFSPMRGANPTFHLLESLWMLAGRNDVAFPATLVKNMRSFTDDGKTFHGAYGYRWRNYFRHDQLDLAIKELIANPNSRRVVLQMWNAMPTTDGIVSDLYAATHGGKDVPCNTAIYFKVRDGRLDMTVSNRSNDVIWGCYGANAVHMSILQEYVALCVGLPVGRYWQVADDLHVYTDKYPRESLALLASDTEAHDLYMHGRAVPTSLIADGEYPVLFNSDLREWFDIFDHGGIQDVPKHTYSTQFFENTAKPMLKSWLLRFTAEAAAEWAERVQAMDWRMSQQIWLANRNGGAL